MDKYVIFNEVPIPASRPRVSKWGTYYNKTYSNYKDKMTAWAKSTFKQPLEGAISINIYFYMPIPKSTSKKKAKELVGTWHTKNTGDIDNLIKGCLDSLNGNAFLDDRQVVQMFTTKKYSFSPRTEICVKSLT